MPKQPFPDLNAAVMWRYAAGVTDKMRVYVSSEHVQDHPVDNIKTDDIIFESVEAAVSDGVDTILHRVCFGDQDIMPEETFEEHGIEDGGRLELFYRQRRCPALVTIAVGASQRAVCCTHKPQPDPHWRIYVFVPH